ncbi:hypothetical protein LOD99_643 [Oopsacas minuta]|uniref:Cornichon n=1 Tax=Oopsacas minuta TaxID=111878 RepID=A0AAV7K0W5_9METZ|nr:hypothetical protein LOD99_643 [Oopsacas minuta]
MYHIFMYGAALLADIALIFLTIWNVVSFDELKNDFKNPVDLCKSLNPLVLPEYSLQAVFSLTFLLTFKFVSLLLTAPITIYHAFRYTRRTSRSLGIYDPTTIMNRRELERCQREGWIKLAYYIVMFFYFAAMLLWSLISYLTRN